MKHRGNNKKFFSKTMIFGEIMFLIGVVLYFYIESIPSSGQALNGIGLGLWSLFALALIGVGAIIACVSLIFWIAAR